MKFDGSTVTGETITDEQIEEIVPPDRVNSRALIRLVKVAMNDGATYLRAEAVKDARARCAAIWNRLNDCGCHAYPPHLRMADGHRANCDTRGGKQS